MNRRSFTKALGAMFALPVMPMPTLAAAPAAVAVPSQARFWAIYMSGLHGKCTPKALQTMLNIPAAEAEGYLNQMILDGVIKPNNLLQGLKSSSSPKSDPDFVERLKDRFESASEDLVETQFEEEVEPAKQDELVPSEGQEEDDIEFDTTSELTS